jgi:hypothetical protein
MSNNEILDAEKLMREVADLVADSRTGHFALGAIDVMGGVCAILIGRGLVDAAEFQAECQQCADIAHRNGTPARALASEFFAAKLRKMAKVKREVAANLMSPDEITKTKN